jgi:iron complex outermembrane receptor protein
MAFRSSPPARFTRSTRFEPRTLALAASLCLAAASAHGQASSTVTITGRSAATPALAGFGDVPLARSPLQASVFGTQLLADQGIGTLGALTRLDASVGDAYNAEGYFANLSSRGYTLDNRFNYRRDGLPINAETALGLDNKDRIELLKGTSGIQAGTSAPGGLVNLVVKRPAGTVRNARVEWREAGSVLGAVDLGQSFGPDGAIGVRLNLAAERLDPVYRETRGRRSLAAVALDWQINPDSLLQFEAESSRQRQPSLVAYSLLGDSVPGFDVIDVRRNLNAQPWVQPVELQGDTASLRWQHQLRGLGEGWRITAQAMTQRLKNDDRTAFPYGVYDANYECSAYCDRFAPDGSFTYWEYISENERRRSDALALTLAGQLRTGSIEHAFETGILQTRYQARLQDQVFDIAGPGNINGRVQSPPSSRFLDANTNRDERSTELFVRDAMRIGSTWQFWAGLRHVRLDRSGVRTSADSNGSLRATDYDRAETTPWLAASAQLTPKTMVYASWGEGLETDVAPNRPRYRNAGASLALTSRQVEVGVKHGTDQVEASLTLFDIDRGVAADFGACSAADSCERRVDGSARHRGIEAAWARSFAAWTLQGSAMLLKAERQGSQAPGVNGQRPVNVPQATLRLGTEYRPPALPGLALQASVAAEGDRVVLPYDASVRIGGWSRLDLGLRWRQQAGATALVWRVGLDNATDRRAWKESPYQFGHAYLYPLAPRTWRASVQAGF